MADENLDLFATRSSEPVLQLVGKHHLRQLALRIGGVCTVALIPIHIVEPYGLETKVVAKARDYNDPALTLRDAIEKQAIEQK